ncbi:MAG: phosphodiester glycosidase family protein, partial [Halanaerobium sp.]
ENNNIQHAVGGGPRLLENGEIKITGEEEKFQPDILNGRAPRTALGITEDNRLLMLTIDGRQSALSIGMTLEETAEILKEMGAVEAMNLDGGASARMVIRGFTMNSPSEDRLISNGVIVGREQ